MLNRIYRGQSSARTLNNFVASVNYSRKSDPKNDESAFKVVKARVRLEDESGRLGSEGSLNWELFSPKGNRFFLPGSLGPAWVNSTTTIYADVVLNDLVDLEVEASSRTQDRLRISSRSCPQLLRENLQEIFPSPEVATQSSPLTMIELSYAKELETEKGAKIFVLAAREICSRLRLAGYWCDFMNPFSGKPFHSYASGVTLYRQDERFRGIGIKLENFNNCTIIGSEEELSFSGNIFTNAPPSLEIIRNLIKD